MEFDFVIVGGGSAGCVLANRLSADPRNSVCLIEAGGEDSHPLIRVPLGLMYLFDHPRFNWRFFSEPQSNGGGKKRFIPRGKVLGGSSAINGMVYARGHSSDYDGWAAAGNPGWAYAEVLPYFLKSERNEDFSDSPVHGDSGPMNVTYLDHYNPLCDMLMDAAEMLEYPRNMDGCGEEDGFGPRQVTQRDGQRESSASAYLAPVRRRSNLTVMTDTEVTAVRLEGLRASGVDIRRDATTSRVSARREVILSAGSLASPQLLMLSGIGPATELSRHGITARHVLPGVGENLQDHFNAVVQCRSPTTIPYGISARSLPTIAKAFIDYAIARRGLLANNGVQAGGYLRTTADLDKPDLQVVLLPALRNGVMRSGRGRMRDWLDNLPLGHGYALTAVLLHPASRGRVGLTSPRPEAPPNVDFNIFSDPEDHDLAVLVKGLQICRRLLATPPFAVLRGDEIRPGRRTESVEQIETYIRKTASTSYHPVGTCKMGPHRDPLAVVDARLRVHGLEGLRVVDASIMPTIVGGNTHAPIVMIAEKAADMVLTDANGRGPER